MPTLAVLAKLVGGEVLGNPEHEITDVADLSRAGAADISFLASSKYLRDFEESAAGAVLVTEAHSHRQAQLIICKDPYLALAKIASTLHPPPEFASGIEDGAIVHPDAKIHADASIRAGAVVETGAVIGANVVLYPLSYVGKDAQLGEGTVLHPGAKVLERCILGKNVVLYAGAVVGADGFGYAPDAKGRRQKIPQIGIVELDDDVEIGANSTIDRATFGATKLARGCKIDNLVQIAHNVELGEDCVIAAQGGVAGSTKLGKRVVMGGQGAISGHISIADDTIFGGRSGVSSTIREPGIYSGTPAMPHREWLKYAVTRKHLPEMRASLRA
ncbi:UDP-3-O-(3-hydroxymyristoyl)glucosamine N-acyltransferase, partial [Myxococcota bacterium]|nr:UDP-3-O-(3-hydroxymyristoyl)glucosamine N-acyltransferase [Myxococcota bacterium]